MDRFNKLLLVLVGLLILNAAAPAPPVSKGQGPPSCRPRQFYLTQTTHNGAQALSACAGGYHMASLWEIIDPSNLRYNTELGFTEDDSGFGPPASFFGWIRTGINASGSPFPGVGNCQAWTSSSSVDGGSLVSLRLDWRSSLLNVVTPWDSEGGICSSSQRVWCVQD